MKEMSSGYAVVDLPAQHDAGALIKLLISHGYSSVTFVQQLYEHMSVRSYVDELKRASTCTGHCHTLGTSVIDRFPIRKRAESTLTISPSNVKPEPEDDFNVPPPQIVTLGHTASSVELYRVKEEDDIKPGTSGSRDEQQYDADYTMGSNKNLSNDNYDGTAYSSTSSPGANVASTSGIRQQPSTSSRPRGRPRQKEEKPAEKCMVCFKMVSLAKLNRPSGNNLYNLRRHAKIHCKESQFSCPVCLYSHCRRDAVVSHIRSQHDQAVDPIDASNPKLEKALQECFRRCFPTFSMPDLELNY